MSYKREAKKGSGDNIPQRIQKCEAIQEKSSQGAKCYLTGYHCMVRFCAESSIEHDICTVCTVHAAAADYT